MVPGLGAQTLILVTGDQFWIQDLELGLGSQDLERQKKDSGGLWPFKRADS